MTTTLTADTASAPSLRKKVERALVSAFMITATAWELCALTPAQSATRENLEQSGFQDVKVSPVFGQARWCKASPLHSMRATVFTANVNGATEAKIACYDSLIPSGDAMRVVNATPGILKGQQFPD
jgi:hypothetical protein